MVWVKIIQFIELGFPNSFLSNCHGILQLGMAPDSFPIMLNTPFISKQITGVEGGCVFVFTLRGDI